MASLAINARSGNASADAFTTLCATTCSNFGKLGRPGSSRNPPCPHCSGPCHLCCGADGEARLADFTHIFTRRNYWRQGLVCNSASPGWPKKWLGCPRFCCWLRTISSAAPSRFPSASRRLSGRVNPRPHARSRSGSTRLFLHRLLRRQTLCIALGDMVIQSKGGGATYPYPNHGIHIEFYVGFSRATFSSSFWFATWHLLYCCHRHLHNNSPEGASTSRGTAPIQPRLNICCTSRRSHTCWRPSHHDLDLEVKPLCLNRWSHTHPWVDTSLSWVVLKGTRPPSDGSSRPLRAKYWRWKLIDCWLLLSFY